MRIPSGRELPQALDWIGFGVESFGGAATTIGGSFDNILVTATRVGCGSSPGTIDTTTTTTVASTTSTTTTTSLPTFPTTTTSTCGFIPAKCNKAINNQFDKINDKSFGKFEQITGVAQEEATLDDMTLYFYCKGRSASKCGDLQFPCTCSRPPCVCPGDTTSTTTSLTTSSPSTSTTTTTTTSTTTIPTTTTTASTT